MDYQRGTETKPGDFNSLARSAFHLARSGLAKVSGVISGHGCPISERAALTPARGSIISKIWPQRGHSKEAAGLGSFVFGSVGLIWIDMGLGPFLDRLAPAAPAKK